MPSPRPNVMVLAAVLFGCGRGVLDDGAGRLGGGAVDASADVAVADVRPGIADARTDVRAELPAPIDVALPPDIGGGDSSCGNQCGRVDTVYVEANCTAVVPCPPTADFTILSVVVGDQQVPTSHIDGWEYLDASKSAIVFNGQVCNDLLAGSRTVKLYHGCLIP